MKFSYRALVAGKVESGEIQAEDRFEALNRLKAQDKVVVALQEAAAGAPSAPAERGWRLEFSGISPTTIAFTTRQLSELLDSGIPLIDGFKTLQELTPSVRLSTILGEISRSVQQGSNLHEALARYPSVFSSLYVNLIRVGEESGTLPIMTSRLADYLEEDENLRGKVKSALSYPFFIFIFSLLLIYLMVNYLLPGFEPMWQMARLDLNNYPITMMLLKLNQLCHNLGDEVLLAVLGFGSWYLYRASVRTQRGGLLRDTALLRVPVLGQLQRHGILARIASTLATLTQSGVGFIEALKMAGGVAGNSLFETALQRISQRVSQGESLRDAFKPEQAIFPALFLQMIGVGEQAGHLPKMLPRLARYYQVQCENSIKALSALLEPVVMLFIGGIVFTFVVGVFAPIMGVVGALQNQS